jgi:hypothetical protein
MAFAQMEVKTIAQQSCGIGHHGGEVRVPYQGPPSITNEGRHSLARSLGLRTDLSGKPFIRTYVDSCGQAVSQTAQIVEGRFGWKSFHVARAGEMGISFVF